MTGRRGAATRTLLPATLALVVIASAARGADADAGAVRVHIGPTPIPGGTAQGAHDITLANDRLAIAFAVDTASPWGVPRGGIVDVGVVEAGRPGEDRASLVDFMPNDWSGWPTTYQRVTLERSTPAEAVVRTERDWGEVTLITRFTLRAGADRVQMRTRMRNAGTAALDALRSGYVAWPEGGHLFGVPGDHLRVEGVVEHPLAQWSAAYGPGWMFGLHAPFADRVGDDSRDRYLQHDLAAGAEREFEAWLQVAPRGELQPLVATEIARRGLPAGRLQGRVSASGGAAVESAAVIVEAVTPEGLRPFSWVLAEGGNYALELPAGRYRLHAAAPAYADSRAREITLAKGDALHADFTDLQPPARLALQVQAEGGGAPLDARITIEEGQRPLIGYFGRSTFFTGLREAGSARLALAPGRYRLKAAHAEGFRAKAAWFDVTLRPGERQELSATIALLADPAAAGWHGGDMHHHSDVLDGFSPPGLVMRSELAAGLDVTLLSDHDSVINNRPMAELARRRGVPFIAATELSPSWAHFNAYPLDAGATIGIDTGRATVQEIFAEARRMGATIVQVNHPYIAYGYFSSHEQGLVPGGYSSDFDLVEINGGEDNRRTLQQAWALWNRGQKAYLSAGSDVHDVLASVSGNARMYAKIQGPANVERFVQALKRGHAYASQGPLVEPLGHLFGDTLRPAAGKPLVLAYRVQAVNGLTEVTLIERGTTAATRRFEAPTTAVPLEFRVTPRGNTWYSLVVKDASGRQAFSNPVWVEPAV